MATLALTPAARAHKLEGEYKVLPGRRVLVESWFETGDVPKGAKVRVVREDGTPLFPEAGELDGKGAFTFAYLMAERLKVNISAGQGHRKELTISPAELATGCGLLWSNWCGQSTFSPPAVGSDGPTAVRPADGEAGRPSEGSTSRRREYEFPIKDLLLGVAVLLSAAALYLAWRNGRRLDELAREVKR